MLEGVPDLGHGLQLVHLARHRQPRADRVGVQRLGTIWSLPTDAQTGERDGLVVVNDQRGTGVVEVTVEYR